MDKQQNTISRQALDSRRCFPDTADAADRKGSGIMKMRNALGALFLTLLAIPAMAAPPVAVDDSSPNVDANDTMLAGAATLFANDDDGEGNNDVANLEVAEVNGAAGNVGPTITLPSGAQVRVGTDGSVSYDPNGIFDDLADGETDTDTFTYTIRDLTPVPPIPPEPLSAPATVTINIVGVNEQPTLADDTMDADEDGGTVDLDLSALVGDVDTTDTHTYSIDTGPAEGSASIVSGSTLRFDPGSAFQDLGQGETRDVTINVIATDDSGTGNAASAANTVTVTVTGVNDQPTMADDTMAANEDGTTVDLDLTTLLGDVDTTDGHTYSINTGPAEGSASIVTSTTLRFDPGSAFQDLAHGETRDVTINVIATDDSGQGNAASSANTVTVTVTGANDQPAMADDTMAATEDGSTVDLDLTTLLSDSDTADTHVYSINTGPAEGSASIITGTTLRFDPGADFQDLRVGATRDVTVTVIATDNSGQGNAASAANTITVTVTGVNDQPALADDTMAADEDGSTVDLDLSTLLTDADSGDTYTYSINTGPAEGGASIVSGTTLRFDPGSAFQDLAEGETRDVTVNVIATDNSAQGNAASAANTVTVTVTGTNDQPTMADDTMAATEDGSTVDLDLTALLGDSDTTDTHVYSIDTGPAEGGASIVTGTTLRFDPGADFQDLRIGATRDVTINIVATDNSGEPNAASAANTITVTVTGVNDQPALADDTMAANEDGTTVDLVLSTLLTDADTGDSYTYSIDTGPAEGSASIVTGTTLRFDPGAAFQDLAVGETRDVTVNVIATDNSAQGNAASTANTVTVTVTGANDQPVLADSPFAATEDGGSVDLSLSGLLSDSDTSDTHTYSITTALGAGEGFAIVLGDILRYSTSGQLQDMAEGELRVFTIGITANDGSGAGNEDSVENTVTLTVTGSNDQPTLADDTMAADEDGSTVDLDLSALLGDVDGTDTHTYAIATAPGEGGASIAGSTLTFDPSVDFQDLADGETRDVTVGVIATDNSGALNDDSVENTITVTVTGVNDRPVLADDTMAATEDGSTVDLDLTTLLTDNDTTDTHTYSINTGPGEGSASIITGTTLRFDPGADFQDLRIGATRDVTINVIATDNSGTGNAASTANTVTVTVTGVNDQPALADDTMAADEDGSTVDLNLSTLLTDADTGDSYTYTIDTGPAEGSASIVTGSTLRFDPGSAFQDLADGETRDVTVNVIATDNSAQGNAASTANTVTVTVTGVNDQPVLADDTMAATEDGATVDLDLTTQLTDNDATDTHTYSINTGPGEGSASIITGTTLRFDPGADFQDLADGETRDVTVNVIATDDSATGNAASVANTVTVTVTGVNDQPTLADDTMAADEDGATVDLDLSALLGDSDTTDTHTYAINTAPGEGGASIAGATLTFDPSTDFQDLADGETRDVTIGVIATDDSGTLTDDSAENTITVTVTGVNDQPVLADDTMAATEDGATVDLDLTTLLTDNDATDTHTYSINTGPGEGSASIITGTTLRFDPGADFQDLADGETRDVTVNVIATDDSATGNAASVANTVTVTVTGVNDQPTLADDTMAADEDGATVDLDLSALLGDSDTTDTHTYAINTAPGEGGASIAGATLTFDPSTDFQDLADGETRDVTIGVIATDDSGTLTDDSAENTITVTVTGVNDQPVLADDTMAATEDGATVDLDLTTLLTDNDATDTHTYSINTGPGEGSASIITGTTLRFDPGADFQDLADGETRDVTVNVIATDDSGAGNAASVANTVTVTVTGVNDQPVLADDTMAATEDGATVDLDLTTLLTDNDTTDTHTYAINTGPAEGGASIVSGSTLRFDPGADFQDLAAGETRDVTVTVIATDDSGTGNAASTANTVTVTVTGINDQPTLADDTMAADEDGATVDLDLSALLGDADTTDTHTYTINTGPAEGGASIAGATLTFDPGADFQDLADGETRDVTVNVIATDDSGAGNAASVANTVTVTVTGVNDQPVLADDTMAATEDGATVDLDLTTLLTDNDTTDTHTYAINTGPAEGGASIVSGSTLRFDPGADFQDLAAGETRDVTVTVIATDDSGTGNAASTANTVTVTVTGINDQPTLADDTMAADEDGATVDLDLSTLLGDADTTDTHTYTINTGPAEGGASIAGATLTFDPGADFQDLADGETRDVTVNVIATDDSGAGNAASVANTVTVTVTGVNDQPVLADDTMAATEDGATVDLDLTTLLTDNDTTDTHTYAINTGPAEGGASIVSGSTLRFDPGADFQDLAAGETRDVTVTVIATDDSGTGNAASTANTVTVTVTGINDQPTLADDTMAADEDGATVDLDLSALLGDSDTTDTHTYAVNTAPGEGGASIAGATLTFDPSTDFQDLADGETRDVTVGVIATDDSGAGNDDSAENTVTVTVTGVNDQPVLADDTMAATEDGATVDLDLTTLLTDNDTTDTHTYAINTGPAEGGASIVTGTTLRFDPGADFQDLAAGETRDVTVNVIATDDSGTGNAASTANTITVTVTGINDQPVLADDTMAADEDGATVDLDLSAILTDNDTTDTHTYSVNTAPGEGGASITGATLTFDPGADFQDLADGETRDVTIGVIATDDSGTGNAASAENTITVTVTGVNDQPVLADDTMAADEDGATVDLDLTTLLTDNDATDNHTYAIDTGPGEGSASIVTGTTLRFDPGADFQDLAVGETRDVTVNVIATDDSGSGNAASVANTVTVTVTGVNDQPTLADDTMAADEDGATVDLDLSALLGDADTTDTHVYTIDTGPAEGGASITGATLTFDPGADFQDLADGETRDVTVNVIATDDSGSGNAASVANTVTVTVTGVNDQPVLADDTMAADEDGATVDLDLTTLLTDNDTTDTHTYAINTGPGEGSASIVTGTTLRFDPGADFQDLAVGETRDVTVNVVVTDDSGTGNAASVANTVTVTVTGVNDQPVLADDTMAADEDGSTVDLDLSAILTDNDTTDTHTYAINTAPGEGGASIAGATLTFDPGADFQDLALGETRDVTIGVIATDDSAAGNADSAENTITVTVTGVNDQPVLADDTMAATEDGATVDLDLSLSLTDNDATDSHTYAVTSAPSEGGASIVGNTLTFDPSTDFQDVGIGQTRDVVVGVTATDDSGAGNASSTQNAVTVTVTGVNDNPEITTNGGATIDVNFNENATGTITSIAGDDIDADDGSSGVALTYDKDTSGGADHGAFTVDPNTGAVSFTTARNFEAQDDADNNNIYEVTVRANDDSGGTDTILIRVALQNVNEAPTASNLTNTVVYTEDQGTVNLVDIVVSDIDDALTAQNITATLTLNPSAAGALTTSGSATYNSGSGVWTITDTLANVNAALASVDFITGADHDTDSTITTLIQDQDGAGPAAGTITLDVTPVNDAPTATNTTQTVGYVEDTLTVAIANIVVSDVDDADYAQTITATLTLADPAGGALTTSGTASYTAGTGVWTITDDLASVNSALAAVAFEPVADYDTDTTVSVVITDQDAAGPGAGTITLDVTPVNDAPTATNMTQTITYNEDTNGVDALQPDIVISDVDDNDVAQTITVTLQMADYLPATLSTPGSSSWNFLTGEWTITDTLANVNAALAALTFDAETDWDEDSSFSVQILDQDLGGPPQGTVTLDVVPLNDDPVVNDQAFDVDENTANGTVIGTVVAFNEESVGCTPPDPGCQTLTFDVSGTAFDIDDDGILTVKNVNDLDREATDSIVVIVTVTDDGTPVEFDTANITVSLNPVNDNTPVGVIDAVSGDEQSTFVFNVLTAGTDLDADLPPETLFVSEVDGDPLKVGVAQELSANGKVVGELTINANGSSTFEATSDVTVEEFDVVQVYTVSDGTFEDSDVRVEIELNPVNDNNPTLTSDGTDLVTNGLEYDEDTYTSSNELIVDLSPYFQDLDIDADGLLDSNTGEDNDSLIYTVTSNTNTTVVSTSISDTDLMIYSPANEHGTSDLTIRATDTADGGGNFVDLTFTLTVNSVNDAPLYIPGSYSDLVVLEDSGDIVIPLHAAFSDADIDADSNPLDDTRGYLITVQDVPNIPEVDTVHIDIPEADELTEDVGVPDPLGRTVEYVTDEGTATIQIADDAHGEVTVTVRRQDSGVPDGTPLFVEETFTITVQGVGDDTPAAADDHYSTNPALIIDEDSDAIVIDVLANDYLGDAPAGVITAGQELQDSLGSDNAWRSTTRLTDRTNTGNYEIEFNGEVSCAADGCQDDETPNTTVDGSGLLDNAVVYKPGPDFNGEDTFVYCIQDAFPGSEAPFTADRTTPTTDQRCATVTVLVNPVNDLPRVPGDTIYEMQQAELLIVPVEEGLATVVSGVDNTHIDGIGCDPFDPGCNPGPTDPQPDDLFFYFQSATTASGQGELLAPFETDGSFNYRPNATFSGSDSFLVDVCEGPGMTADNCIFGVTVTITVESVSGDPEGSEEGAVEVDFDLANIPLELPIGPEANVLIVNDDSGSMDWDISTDQTNGVYYFDGTNNYVRYVMKATAGSSYVAASEEEAPGSGVWRLRNSVYNSIYYNPEIQYTPWKGLNASDVDFPNSNPNAALHNPLVTSGSNFATNLELPQDYTGRAVFTSPITCSDVCTNTDKSGNCTNYEEQCTGGNTSWQSVAVEDYWVPRYYTWDDKNGNGVLDANPSPHSDPSNSEGTLVEIRSGNTYPKYTDRTDCITLPSNCTYAEELQNFANWFTYNRNREFTAKSALGQVVAAAENIRIGYAKLNSSSNIIDIQTMNSSERTGAKADLLDAIYLTGSSGGTPLRRSLEKAGRFFECKTGGYFGHGNGIPGDGECPLYAAPAGNCQQNFTLLISDGTWNGSTPYYAGDADDPTDNDDPTDTNFDGGVYAGGTDSTLADVAMHFYERDLHTLGNEVPTTARDRDGAAANAFEDMNNEKMHQHMKTYTIGFGVDGVVEDDDVPTDYTQSFNWGNPFSSNARKIDDMRHAAVNGRGQYLSAGNASGLADALLDAFDEFQKASGSASAVSFNSQEVQQDTLVFRAFYNTKNNTGDLIAQDFDVDDNGVVVIGDEAWNAAAQLDLKTFDERVIITLDRTTNTGIPFRPTSLNSDQRALFISDGSAPIAQQNLEVLQKVNYLRGDSSNERPAGNFRERPGIEGKLGDIVHSAPTFIGPPNRTGREPVCLQENETTGSCELWNGWAPGYSSFVADLTFSNRPDVVYVAANDGMFHAFDAVTGNELLAYVPDNLMTGTYSNKITGLLNYEYVHEYFVDSSPAVNDVHIDWDNDGDKEWRTVVVNGQGAGAKAYFALDITDPSKFTEATADQVVLWEFTDEDDAYPVVGNDPETPLTNTDGSMRMDLQTVPQPVKDLGYTLGVPTLAMSNARDPDGTPRWIAAFGNGYNSTAGIAKLFVLFLDAGIDGTWCHPDKIHNTVLDSTPLPSGCPDTDTEDDYDFVKLDTTFGTFLDNEGNNLPNGLGEVRLIDFDGNGTADYGYAGDMQGNLFRFNMTSDDFLQWSVTKIFEARYKPGTVDETIQPITTQALAITHPTEEEGIILMFGTGAYMRTGDATDSSIQSIYGIWDRFGPEEILKSDLVEQWYTGINDSVQGQVRVLSDNPVDYSIIENRRGWFIDLDTPAPETPIPTDEPTGDAQFPGERAIRNIQVRGGLAFTASVFPRPVGSCVGQAGGALLSFCPDTGSSECFINQVFDLNNDGSFNAGDNLADDNRTGAGVILTNETPPTDSAFIGSKIVTQQGTDLTVIDTNTSFGANTGRTSWRRLDATY